MPHHRYDCPGAKDPSRKGSQVPSPRAWQVQGKVHEQGLHPEPQVSPDKSKSEPQSQAKTSCHEGVRIQEKVCISERPISYRKLIWGAAELLLRELGLGFTAPKSPQMHLCSVQSDAKVLEQTLTPMLVFKGGWKSFRTGVKPCPAGIAMQLSHQPKPARTGFQALTTCKMLKFILSFLFLLFLCFLFFFFNWKGNKLFYLSPTFRVSALIVCPYHFKPESFIDLQSTSILQLQIPDLAGGVGGKEFVVSI